MPDNPSSSAASVETRAMPTYHDLHIETASIERTSIFDLPYELEVTCTRTGGWRLWRHREPRSKVEILTGNTGPVLVAGEYDGPDKWLRLDVAGQVIVDSRERPADA